MVEQSKVERGWNILGRLCCWMVIRSRLDVIWDQMSPLSFSSPAVLLALLPHTTHTHSNLRTSICIVHPEHKRTHFLIFVYPCTYGGEDHSSLHFILPSGLIQTIVYESQFHLLQERCALRINNYQICFMLYVRDF